MPTLKEIRQRLGWAVDQLENFIQTAGGQVPQDPPTDSALYHVQTARAGLEEHIGADDTSDDGHGDSTGDDTTTEPEPEPEPTDADPDVVFDPDQYTSTEELRSDPVGVFDTRADMQSSRIFLDSLGMRYDWVDQGADNAIAIGRRIPLSSGVKELWVEMDLRWSENFMCCIDMSQTETYAHKMFFLEAKAPATDPNWETSDGQSVYRWSVHWPGGGATNPPNGQIKVETPATTSGANVDKNIGVNAADYFDGRWHTVRLHISHDPGLFEMWIDGERVLAMDGFTVHPEVVTTALLPGRNKDDGIESGTESLWWGTIKAWTEDPGW